MAAQRSAAWSAASEAPPPECGSSRWQHLYSMSCELLRLHERRVRAVVALGGEGAQLRMECSARRVDPPLRLLEALRVDREHRAIEAPLVGGGSDELGGVGHLRPLLAVPARRGDERRGLHLLLGGDDAPDLLRDARELRPLGERREAAESPEDELAGTRLGQVGALVDLQRVLPPSELLEPGELHLEAMAVLRQVEHAEKQRARIARQVGTPGPGTYSPARPESTVAGASSSKEKRKLTFH